MKSITQQESEHTPLSDAVLSVLNHPDIPDRLLGLIQDAVLECANQVGVGLVSPEILPYAVPTILERLERRASGHAPTARAARLSGLISGLLTDSDTPESLRLAVEEAAQTIVVDSLNRSEWPREVFERALTVYMSDEEGGAR